MALSTSSARTSVKNRLGIPSADTTWDTIIDDFVTQAVNRLSPKAQQEVAAQNATISVDEYGEAIVVLSGLTTPIADVRKVEVSFDGAFSQVDSTYRHGTSLYIRELSSANTTARIYGLNAYLLTTVPSNLELAVFWFAMAEFYDYLAGSKSKYNIYMQSSGARGVDNMRDESAYYEAKAEAAIDEHATLYGA